MRAGLLSGSANKNTVNITGIIMKIINNFDASFEGRFSLHNNICMHRHIPKVIKPYKSNIGFIIL